LAGVLSLGKADLFKLSDKKARIKITRLAPQSDVPEGTLAFQYWPETITDTKATNWQNKAIPGGNLPLYAWINGAERIISFSTIFATDVDVTKWVNDVHSSDVDESFQGELKQKGLDSRNFDVRGALLWLRSFLMPTYNVNGSYFPPPKLLLSIPGSRFGLYAGSAAGDTDSDSITAVMTQCDFEYRAFFPNGVPRIVSVSLAFAQIAQRDGIVNFPGYIAPKGDVIDGLSLYKIGKS